LLEAGVDPESLQARSLTAADIEYLEKKKKKKTGVTGWEGKSHPCRVRYSQTLHFIHMTFIFVWREKGGIEDVERLHEILPAFKACPIAPPAPFYNSPSLS
jgi:hypothetical protein